MNIVYIAPFWDGTGYSHMAQQTVIALHKAGHYVVPITVKLTGQKVTPHPLILELEKRPRPDKIDITIQNILPNMMTKIHQAGKNIGYFYCETTNFKSSDWQYYLNNMDEVWVCSDQNASAALVSNIRVPIKTVFGIYDEGFYHSKTLEGLEEIGPYTYTFYCIGDFSYRKSIMELIEAYFHAFTKADNVHLVLKTFCDGKSNQESAKYITEQIQKLKASMRKGRVDVYPRITLITDYLSDEQIIGLHNLCDCFVSLEKGAAWNIPAFDAMALGKAVIVNGWGGQTQFVYGEGTKLLPFIMTPVKKMDQCPYMGLYTCNESWASASISEAVSSMQNMYKKGKMVYDRAEWKAHWGEFSVKNMERVLSC